MSKIPFYINRIRKGVRADGLHGAVRELKRLSARLTASLYFNARLTQPEVIWDGWDVCIVLDACRPDVLGEFTDEYEFLPSSIPTIKSVGGTSSEWMSATFDRRHREYVDETAYITGNPYTEFYPQVHEAAILEEVWRQAWDTDLGTQPPRPLTDRAITVWREQTPARMIIHYMQPHFPSVPDPIDSGMELETFGEEWSDNVWTRLQEGNVSDDRVWKAYRNNCRYVLDEVELLLDNLAASRVVITADHGNAFGEWGYYGHPEGVPIPALREVPWVETSATDEKTHAPEPSDKRRRDGTTISDRLTALGYKPE